MPTYTTVQAVANKMDLSRHDPMSEAIMGAIYDNADVALYIRHKLLNTLSVKMGDMYFSALQNDYLPIVPLGFVSPTPGDNVYVNGTYHLTDSSSIPAGAEILYIGQTNWKIVALAHIPSYYKSNMGDFEVITHKDTSTLEIVRTDVNQTINVPNINFDSLAYGSFTSREVYVDGVHQGATPDPTEEEPDPEAPASTTIKVLLGTVTLILDENNSTSQLFDAITEPATLPSGVTSVDISTALFKDPVALTYSISYDSPEGISWSIGDFTQTNSNTGDQTVTFAVIAEQGYVPSFLAQGLTSAGDYFSVDAYNISAVTPNYYTPPGHDSLVYADDYMPVINIRKDNVDLNDPPYKDMSADPIIRTQEYIMANRLLDHLGMGGLNTITESYAEADDIDDFDDIFAVFGAPVTTDDWNQLHFLYATWEEKYYVHKRGSSERPTYYFNYGQGFTGSDGTEYNEAMPNFVQIKGKYGDYDFFMVWDYIEIEHGYDGGFVHLAEDSPAYETEIEEFHSSGTQGHDNGGEATLTITPGFFSIKQYRRGGYTTTIKVVGLRTENRIPTSPTHYKRAQSWLSLDEDREHDLLVPMINRLWREMSITDRSRVGSQSFYMLVYVVHRESVSWFNAYVLPTLIQILVMIGYVYGIGMVMQGFALSLYTGMLAIFKSIGINILLTETAKQLVKYVSQDVALAILVIISLIAGNASGGGISGLNADSMLAGVNAVGSSMQIYGSVSLDAVKKQMEETAEVFKDEFEKIEKLGFAEARDALNKMLFAHMREAYPLEEPSVFNERVLNPDVGLMALDAVTNSATTLLQLPEV